MAHPYHHALSSVKKFGGKPQDYQPIHDWFDETKASFADWRHRALRHHSLGIFWCEEKFGTTVRNSDGKEVPVRLIGEQHVREDLGWIPNPKDWLVLIGKGPENIPAWCTKGVDKNVGRDCSTDETKERFE